MRLDIYRRPENNGKFSYLAVPEGKMIPQEAINSEWETTDRSVEFEEDASHLPEFAIENPLQQIHTKGYAITSVKHLASG
ncbi:MAG: DUF6139 family protein [Burkholderiaceae bacterium]